MCIYLYVNISIITGFVVPVFHVSHSISNNKTAVAKRHADSSHKTWCRWSELLWTFKKIWQSQLHWL